MSPLAVQFGAGAIGRGFLADLFASSGFGVVFVDVDASLVRAINEQAAYTIRTVGPRPAATRISQVRAAMLSDRESVTEAISAASIVGTAVGAMGLGAVGAALAAGLRRRDEVGAPPLNVLVAENLPAAPAVLAAAVRDSLPEDCRDDVLRRTGFVHTVVSRMVPARTADEIESGTLDVRVEAYRSLPVDAAAVVPPFPKIAGVELSDNFAAFVARKLFTHNCAHAVLGYTGAAAGFTLASEAIADSRIRALVGAVMFETGEALIRRFGFDRTEQRRHEEDLLGRFANAALGDTCLRLARDPLRKLHSSDRLVGAARLCEAMSIEPRAVAWGIAAALQYAEPSDDMALELQDRIAVGGVNSVLREVCGILPGEKLHALIIEALQVTRGGAI